MHLINEILQEPEFRIKPPVLIDIGASGKIHKKWRKIARYSICVAFDADEREFNISENNKSGFKKLYVYHRLVHTESSEKVPFYLTRSPFCSSMLEPDMESLQHWEFADAFRTEKVVTTGAVDIAEVITKLNLNYVDWFKSDSQGIDLRLYKRLVERLRKPPLAVDFEPGIINAYRGEDMFRDVLVAMTGSDYWMSSLQVRGSKRIHSSLLPLFNNISFRRRIPLAIRNSPCWCEMTYLHMLSGNSFERRDYLICIVFSLIEKQYGFALELADRGTRIFGDDLFRKIYKIIYRNIVLRSLNIPMQLIRRAFYKYK